MNHTNAHGGEPRHIEPELLEDLALHGAFAEEIPSAEVKAIHTHLATCEECRAAYEDVALEVALFEHRRAVASEPPPFLAPEMLDELADEQAERDRERSRPILARVMPVVVAAAACAAVFTMNVSSVGRLGSSPAMQSPDTDRSSEQEPAAIVIVAEPGFSPASAGVATWLIDPAASSANPESSPSRLSPQTPIEGSTLVSWSLARSHALPRSFPSCEASTASSSGPCDPIPDAQKRERSLYASTTTSHDIAKVCGMHDPTTDHAACEDVTSSVATP